tara:strand:- start:451 stop:969 length:519 start_codon:yes stop_codon:yes gene_type:complete
MPNYQGVWSLSTHYQNRSGWPFPLLQGDIGVVANTSTTSSVDYFTITATGNSISWGDLTSAHDVSGACGSSTRAVWAGGGGNSSQIDYITVASLGVGARFGYLSDGRGYIASASNATRGLFAGGNSATVNTIDYITIATEGNSTDFGNLPAAKYSVGGSANTTRALFFGGDG